MIVFWVIVVILVAGALLALALPLLGLSKRPASATSSEVNLSVHRDRLRELDADLAAGTLSEEQYRNARSELESQVLEDSSPVVSAVPPAGNRRSTALTVGVSVAVPVLAISLYLVLGNPAGVEPQSPTAESQQAGAEQSHAVTQEQIEAMVARLADKLKSRPDDSEGWVMLARSYTAMRRYDDASAAYAHLAGLLPKDASLLADYADVLAMSKKTLQGEPEKIIMKALKADSGNVKALSLAGSAAFERKDYRSAVKWWQKLLSLQPADSQDAASTTASINEARALAGMPPLSPQANSTASVQPGVVGGTVSGTVSLDPALKARVAATDSVFIFARAAEGPRMPLAVIRKTVQDLPITFKLDDSMAVMPSLKLSSVAKVVVGARISKSGSATPSPGDMQGQSQPVKIGENGVNVTINSEVK